MTVFPATPAAVQLLHAQAVADLITAAVFAPGGAVRVSWTVGIQPG
ncbi:MAG TPA: hypothetical protein VNF47_21960 [Streptosporangiaceae bacterium]|nr:hypothetical protein [Streptosporangiaceae bacterium]